MILVVGGTYLRGSAEQPYAASERVHETTVSDYYLACTEISQAQYKAVMGANPSKIAGADKPVDSVSWLDAVSYCNKRSEREGFDSAYQIKGSSVIWDSSKNGYRLPTEAEWEYAARGGVSGAIGEVPLKKAPFAGSFNADDVAWYDRNSGKTTKAVATKKANELGFYDMSGNVWEWCWDWFGEYPKGAVINPTGSEKASGQRVLRGGAWFTPSPLLRTTYRYWSAPSFKANTVGFRVARNAS